MAEESVFLDYVGDSPRMRVLQYLIEGRELDYTLTDMLNAGVSWGTLNTLVPNLVELGVVVKTRKIGRATLYKVNQENEVAKHLVAVYDSLVMKELDKIKQKIKVKVS